MILEFCSVMKEYCTTSSSDTMSDSSSDFTSESEGSSRPRKCRLDDRRKRYKEGSRKAYKTQKDLSDPFEKSDIPGVGDVCTPALKQIKETFEVLKHQGTELKKRKNQLPHPKRPDREHYQKLDSSE